MTDTSDLEGALHCVRLEAEAERACEAVLGPLMPVTRKQVLLRLLVATDVAPPARRPTEALRGAVVHRDIKPENVVVRRAKAKPEKAERAPKTRKPPSSSPRREAQEARRLRVLDMVNKTDGYIDCDPIARRLGCSRSVIVVDLNALADRGQVRTEGEGRGHKKWLALRSPATPARPAGRQTGAKSKPKPSSKAATDEEEDAPVKLSIVTGINRTHEHLPPVIPTWLDAETPRPKPPGLALGKGERRDCVHDATCLMTFLRGVGRPKAGHVEPQGHCPPTCGAFTQVRRAHRIELASVQRQTNFS